jgi:hypothetical protein
MSLLASEYDVGFVGETGSTFNRLIALTNKQFTYMLAGIPTVLSNIPSHQNFGKGLAPAVSLYNVNDNKSLAKTLDEYLQDTGYLAQARAISYQLGQDRFNWERERNILLDEVTRVLE